MTQKTLKHKTDPRPTDQKPPAQMTFMDHIRELQSRLFYIGLTFLVGSAIAYPFFTQIANAIVEPLGNQHLVYLTPGGAFSFVIKVCMYVGIIFALPMIMYQLFQFLTPVMPNIRRRKLIAFTIASFVLAIIGIGFAYYISLPAALYFLTSFSVANIDPMLTIDSYFSFAMAYLVAGALLFQLPLLMLVIDNVRPITPQQLMSYQKHVILGSAIIAAILSPTPDAVNQLLLAGPIVAMYQVGTGLVAVQHRSQRVKSKTSHDELFDNEASFDVDELFETPQQPNPISVNKPIAQVVKTNADDTVSKRISSARTIDGFSPRNQVKVPARIVERQFRRIDSKMYSRRSLDGMISPARS